VKKIYVIISIFFLISEVWGQSIPFKRSYFKGKKGFSKAYQEFLDGIDAYEQNVYYEAIGDLEKANEFNPDNAEVNYMLGDCYLHTIYKAKALKYLKKAEELDPEVDKKIYYKLGLAYQYNYKFKEAKKEYYHFKISLQPEELYVWDSVITKKMNECDVGLLLMSNPTNGLVVNVKNVNSEYSDYAALVTGDGKVMYFTSRRKGTTGGGMDYNDMQYYEDVYYSVKKKYRWQQPINVGPPINTKRHDATVGISIDGLILFVYRGNVNNGDIFYSVMRDSTWMTPRPLPDPINTKYHENSASLAYDNRTLYFVSDRPGGYGGKDIYVTVMQDDSSWSTPVNLGPTINTPYNEDGVFIHPDNRTLYFSSQGHKTMGGYDIFFSVKDKDGKWTEPQNLGYPINTPDDDVFFVTDASGEQGYYTSVRIDGSGMKDIFRINFPSTENSQQTSKITFLHGKALTKDSLPVKAYIYLYDLKTNKHIGTYFTNDRTGAFAVSLPDGHLYGLYFKPELYLPTIIELDNSTSHTFKDSTMNMILSEKESDIPIHIVNNDSLAIESLPLMNNLADYVKLYSYKKFEVSGTSNKVNAIKGFFSKKGVTNVIYKEDNNIGKIKFKVVE